MSQALLGNSFGQRLNQVSRTYLDPSDLSLLFNMASPHGTGTPHNKEDLLKMFPDISQSVITAAVTAFKNNYAEAFGTKLALDLTE